MSQRTGECPDEHGPLASVIRGPLNNRRTHHRARETLAAARVVAASRGRADDSGYIAYLAALGDLTSGRVRAQVSAVHRLTGLLRDPRQRDDAQAALREFVDGQLRRSRRGVSMAALVQAARAVEETEHAGTSGLAVPEVPTNLRGGDRTRLVGGFRLLGRALRAEPRLFTVSVTGGLTFAAATVTVALALRAVVAQLWVPAMFADAVSGQALAVVAGICAVAFAGRGVGTLVQRVAARLMQLRLATTSRDDIVARYRDLGPVWYRGRRPSDLTEVVESDVEIAWRPVAVLPIAAGGVVMVLVSLVALCVIDWRIAVVGVGMLSALGVISLSYLHRIEPDADRAAALRAQVHAIAAWRPGQPPGPAFTARSSDLRAAMIRVRRIRAFFDPVLTALPVVGELIVVGIMAVQLRAGAGSGTVGAVFLFAVLASPVRGIGVLLAELPGAATAAERLDDVLSAADELTYAGVASATTMPRPTAVKFDHVRFAYAGYPPVIQDLSFDVQPGRVVAVVGDRGAGKSTFAMLAARRVDPILGTVRIGGRDLREYSRESLDDVVAYVPAAPRVFGDSIRSAVTLGRTGVDDRTVWWSLRVVQADGFVARLPHGLDSAPRGRLSGLSRGQQYRLAIAGAVAGRPSVVVLDALDGAGAVDPATLSAIHSTGATVIVVTDHADTITMADEVVFLGPDGRIAMRPHGQLLHADQHYEELFAQLPRRRTRAARGRWADDLLHAPPRRDPREGTLELLAAASGLVRNGWRGRRARPAASVRPAAEEALT